MTSSIPRPTIPIAERAIILSVLADRRVVGLGIVIARGRLIREKTEAKNPVASLERVLPTDQSRQPRDRPYKRVGTAGRRNNQSPYSGFLADSHLLLAIFTSQFVIVPTVRAARLSRPVSR